MNLDLSNHHLQLVLELLRQYLPKKVKVWAFGSRVHKKNGPFSDLDLALDSKEKIDFGTLANLEYAFEESNLPFKVDVIDLFVVDESFKKIIEKNRVPLPF